MSHHLAGTSNSAKRRQAEAATMAEHDQHEASEAGPFASVKQFGANAAHAAQEGIESLRMAGKENFAIAEHTIEDQIVRRPFTSVLAALSIGILLGVVSTTLCMRANDR